MNQPVHLAAASAHAIATGLRLIDVNAVPATPWRNGGGVTRELFAWPSATAWQLRISVADIDADGPFSNFQGIDRWFAVVQGNGVVLRFDESGPVNHPQTGRRLVLDAQSPPAHFKAERAPHCSLQAGATRDLNLMSRRDAGTSRMQRAASGTEWLSAAPLRALFSTGPVRLQIDGADVAPVPAWTLVISDHAAHQHWRALPQVDSLQAWWMDFQPQPVPAPIDMNAA